MADETLGKYEIRGQLGRGAMGTVLDGWDPVIARRVAIKTVRLPDPSDAEAQEELARFKREAQAAGRLNHPNIVGVFDYGEIGEVAFIVMEFVDGRTLKAVLDNGERMALPEIERVMRDILAGLQFSHDRGVVHRDIKPANIMITQAGQAKIADFGIARIESSSMTQAGTVLGTPAYMSPEQFMGQVVDLRTDIYSCGVLLYQLLTGERPFEGSMTAIMHKALNTAPPKPSDLSVTSPPAFDAVVARAMAKRPEERFPNASALSDAIAEAVAAPAPALPLTSIDDLLGTSEATMVARPGGANPAQASPPAAPGPLATPAAERRPRRTGAAILVAAVIVLAAIGGGAYGLLGGNQRSQVAGLSTPTTPTGTGAQSPPTQATRPAATATAPSPSQRLPAEQSVPAQQAAVTPPPSQSVPSQQAALTPLPTPTPSTRPPPPQPMPGQQAAIAPQPTPTSPSPAVPPPAVVLPPPPLSPQSPSSISPSPPVAQPQLVPPPTPVEPARLSPAALRQMVGAVIATAPCSLISSDVNDDGTAVTVTGLAANAGMAALRRTIEASAATADVNWQVGGFDGPYCPAIETVRAVAGRGSGLSAVPNMTKLHDNDLLVLQATLPDFPAHLQIDYFDSKGGIAHLVPTTPDVTDHTFADRLYPARSHQSFGDREPSGYDGQHVGPPAGTDMILVIASQTPLMKLRTQVEGNAQQYVAQLQAAIDAARRRGRVAATAFLLDVAIP